jgi:hypothetical protein
MRAWVRRFLLVSLFLIAMPLAAQEPAGDHGVSPEERRLRAVIDSDLFKVDRDLTYYAQLLPDEFIDRLSRMGAEDHWIDMGAGLAAAGYQLHGAGPDSVPGFDKQLYAKLRRLLGKPKDRLPKVTAISKRIGGPKKTFGGKVRPMADRFLEDIPDSEIKGDGFGEASLITDVFGVFPYTDRLSQALAKYGRLLKKDGVAFIFLGPWPAGGGDVAMFNSDVMVGSQRVPLPEWMTTAPFKGLKVELVGVRPPTDFLTPYSELGKSNPDARLYTLKLTRTGDKIEVPELAVEWTDGFAPPVRRLRQMTR